MEKGWLQYNNGEGVVAITAIENGWLQYNNGEGVVAIQQWRRSGCNTAMEKGWWQYNNGEGEIAMQQLLYSWYCIMKLTQFILYNAHLHHSCFCLHL